MLGFLTVTDEVADLFIYMYFVARASAPHLTWCSVDTTTMTPSHPPCFGATSSALRKPYVSNNPPRLR